MACRPEGEAGSLPRRGLRGTDLPCPFITCYENDGTIGKNGARRIAGSDGALHFRGGAGNYPAISNRSNFHRNGHEAMKHKPEPDSDLILYQTEDGRTRLQVRLEGGTVWLSLNQMVELFQRDKSVISRHIKNIWRNGNERGGELRWFEV